VIKRKVPVARSVGTGIGQNASVPHLQGRVTHLDLLAAPYHLKVMKQTIKGKTLLLNEDHTPVHLRSVVRLQVLKRRRREAEGEGTEVQVLVSAAAEVVIEGDRITLAALPLDHVTAHYHQECITVMATTSVSILVAAVPSVAAEVVTRNKTNDGTAQKRIRIRVRRRSIKVITLDRHVMTQLVTFVAVRAL